MIGLIAGSLSNLAQVDVAAACLVAGGAAAGAIILLNALIARK